MRRGCTCPGHQRRAEPIRNAATHPNGNLIGRRRLDARRQDPVVFQGTLGDGLGPLRCLVREPLESFFVRPADGAHREAHRLWCDGTASPCNPCCNSISQTCIRLGLGVFAKPFKINHARIISAPRLECDIARFALPSENATDRGAPNAKQLCRLSVAPAATCFIRSDHSPP